jgi:para-nitrobenzyl esterase
VWLIMNADNTRRANVQTLGELKFAQGRAPAYAYYFAWRSPVHKGQMKAYHTLDIPFVFNNVDVAASMTGSGQERYALQHKMSAAWAAFARTGNPNHSGIPRWQPFDADRRATMIFNNECRAVNDPYREERLSVGSKGPLRTSAEEPAHS